MKLAIIGSGPLAILCAQHFDQLGAEVVLFQKNALGGNARFLLEHFPAMEVIFDGKKLSLNSLWEEQLIPVIKNIEEKNLTKAGEVLRVHKRFLHPNEVISKRTRMHDLFRVIFSVNPKEAILKQLEENPDMFKQLGEQVVNSLHMPVESFEDFDIVVDARGRGKSPVAMGPSAAAALNENNIKISAPLFYEKDIFTNFSLEGKTQLVVVGNSESAILTLLKCQEWLFSKPNHTLSWVTPTSVEKEYHNEWINTQLKNLLKVSNDLFEQDKIVFEKKMFEWRDLEDYIKAKIPKPIEPEAKLKIYQGYDVTSVDRLLDRTGVFATIESPDFRSFAPVHDLKTLPAEAILIGCGVEDDKSFARGLQVDEAGYYCLDADNLEDGIAGIKVIEEKIMAFFSRAQ
jgi:hypothetical protein